MLQSLRTQRYPLIGIMIVVVAVIGFRVLPGPRNVDDSFIIFRYARNLVEGHGLVYNLGVRTLGTTTPLFTLWMAFIAFITRGEAYPWYALITSAVADAVSASLLFLLVRKVTESLFPAILIGLLWAVAPMSVTFAIGGMETSVTIMWMLAATTAFVYEQRVWVGIFAGFGLLTRPDAAIWILPLGIYQLIAALRQTDTPLIQRIPYPTWLAGLGVIVPWGLVGWWYYGNPLPSTLGAKSVAYTVESGSAFVRLLQVYATPFMEFDTFGQQGAMVGIVAYVLLNLFAMLYVWQRQPRLIPLLLYPWLYIVIFATANPLIFRWYNVPPMPAWILGAVLGVWSIITPIGERTNKTIVYPLAAGLLGLLWGGMSLNAWVLSPDHGASRPAPDMAWHEIELHYRDIALLLRDEYGVTPDNRVASADIGAVGYFSEATIIDTVGLVSPELSAYYPFDDTIRIRDGDDPQNYAVPPQLILDTQPEYFVTMEGFIRLGLIQMDAFTDNYTLVREIPTGYYGTGMQLWARNDVLAE
jgi:hypothetical protein